MPSGRSRRAVTLIELIVVLAIIAVLVGLLVVAIVRVRETANIAHSKNNVKQIGLGTHSFAAAHHGSLPQLGLGGTRIVTNSNGTQTAYPPAWVPSLFVQILPYVESQHAKLGRGRFKPVPLFLSPSDPTAQEGLDGGAAVTSYAANAVAFLENPKLPATFVDGTANTIAFAEHYSFDCNGIAFPYWENGGGQSDGYYNRFGKRPAFAETSDVHPVTHGWPPVTMPYSRWQRSVDTFQIAPRVRDCDPLVPQTPHSSGMIVGMADGSVRQIGPGVAPQVFWALVTPSSGDIPGTDW